MTWKDVLRQAICNRDPHDLTEYVGVLGLLSIKLRVLKADWLWRKLHFCLPRAMLLHWSPVRTTGDRENADAEPHVALVSSSVRTRPLHRLL